MVGEVRQNLDRVNPAHYVGKGKIDEIKASYDEADANLLFSMMSYHLLKYET